MQKQEIPHFTPCHSGSDLALNQLGLLQAINRPPWRHHECSLNSIGPLGPLSIVPTWWVAPGPARTNRTLVSRRANQRAAEVRPFSYHHCELSSCVHKWPLLGGQEGLVPFHSHCRELMLCLLSSVLSWCCQKIATGLKETKLKNTLCPHEYYLESIVVNLIWLFFVFFQREICTLGVKYNLNLTISPYIFCVLLETSTYDDFRLGNLTPVSSRSVFNCRINVASVSLSSLHTPGRFRGGCNASPSETILDLNLPIHKGSPENRCVESL